MADDADIANAYIDNEVSRALDKMRMNKVTKAVSKFCAECGEKVPDARRKLGFHLCLECAAETERRKSLFADY